MTEDRTVRVWAAIDICARWEGEPVSIRHACIACSQAMSAIGAGLSMTLDGGPREPVYATDPRSRELEELQSTLGEGPCRDAVDGNGPILVADLASPQAGRLWPVFAPAATERGVKAMFAVPIAAGAARVGVLDLYRLREGLLSTPELAEVLTFADAALVLALDRRGGIATDLNDVIDAGFNDHRAEVHQAAGMVAAQIGAGVTDALALLRAHSYLYDRRLGTVACDVVNRRLRFSPDGDDRDQDGNTRPGGRRRAPRQGDRGNGSAGPSCP